MTLGQVIIMSELELVLIFVTEVNLGIVITIGVWLATKRTTTRKARVV